ncbi:hypothetical protein BV25DRAFT_1780208, partial [Artomyces pyxidatus]
LNEDNWAELREIWAADKRVPTLASRKIWAHVRGLAPNTVNNWFSRQKKALRLAGKPVPTDTYDMPIGAPR